MNEIDVKRTETADTLLVGKYDLDNWEEFIQAGRELIELGRAAFLGLGEIVSYRAEISGAKEDYGKLEQFYHDCAVEWGVSRSSVIKAHVVADKFHEVERPRDVSPTLVYEILSGAKDEEDAEAGFDKALEEGWGVQDVRIAKSLRKAGLTNGWEVPYLYFGDDGAIWAKDSQGNRVKVMRRVRDGNDELAELGLVTLRRRANI